MIKVPPQIALKATIRSGSVYYFRHESFSSLEPHYFVVINVNPAGDQVILLICASSKRHAIGANCPKKSFITIGHTQYSAFKEASVLNCNYVIEQTIDQLISRLSNKTLQMKPEMDIKLVKLLREGVLSSPLVPERIKSQLRT